ncbi:alpha-1,2-fucosyltransferase [Flavihumibacter sp. R14]|nr:alpha-1,2-fucosyltransferase [Flavihumibacter soli]
MIIVKLQGGLGNQMFQYALGRAFVNEIRIPLYFDATFFRDNSANIHTIRSYQLDLFDIEVVHAPENNLGQFINPSAKQKYLNKIGLFRKTYFKELTFDFKPEIFNLPTPVYLDGYWQSEKYFERISGSIREAFDFRKHLSSTSVDISKEIAQKGTSVSIHIRRGDYISSSSTNRVHGTCSIDYYRNAMALMEKKIKSPFYYFFSDDTDWVQDNLIDGLENCCLISHNTGSDSWQDMALMSQCQHHIIANSSFSWWGAWLNPSDSKVVVAPQNWFADTNLNSQTKSLIPENWICL